jgi:hypothetical protein
MAKAPKNREVDELGPKDAAWLLDTTLDDKKLMQPWPKSRNRWPTGKRNDLCIRRGCH